MEACALVFAFGLIFPLLIYGTLSMLNSTVTLRTVIMHNLDIFNVWIQYDYLYTFLFFMFLTYI